MSVIRELRKKFPDKKWTYDITCQEWVADNRDSAYTLPVKSSEETGWVLELWYKEFLECGKAHRIAVSQKLDYNNLTVKNAKWKFLEVEE